MKRRHFPAVLVMLMLAAAAVRAAPGVRLTFHDGRVWLTASGATAAQILAEWARVGGTRIVNADRINGPALTLDIRDVPEMEALEVVLRGAGGFIAASRAPEQSAAAPRLSRLEQVMVLPASTTPVTPAPPAPAAASLPPPAPAFDAAGARRIIGPDGQPVPDDQEDAPPPPGGPGR